MNIYTYIYNYTYLFIYNCLNIGRLLKHNLSIPFKLFIYKILTIFFQILRYIPMFYILLIVIVQNKLRTLQPQNPKRKSSPDSPQ